jgi:hypothetical protein
MPDPKNNIPEPDGKGAEQGDYKRRNPDAGRNKDAYDKTVEDSFPASDPPSSIPDPEEENAA